ncbi:MAG: hypothetical protein PSX80_07445 [bacterium]|nr:hypothetical protein [bacterium]
MKRVFASLILAVILLSSYFLLTYSVRRTFLFGPGPFVVGKIVSDYFVPSSRSDKEVPYDESKVLLILLSVSVVSIAVPMYIFLGIEHSWRMSRLRLP